MATLRQNRPRFSSRALLRRSGMSRHTLFSLSKRERELVSLAAQGLTDQAIAHRIGISPGTVASYWVRLRGKLGSHSRTELVAICLRRESEALLRDLRVQNQRLRAQLEQIGAPGSSMGYSRLADLPGIVERVPEGLCLVDERGCILDCTEAFAAIFDFTRTEMIGVAVESLVPKPLRSRHAANREAYTCHPDDRAMGDHLGTYGTRKDGSEVLISASLSGFETPLGTRVLCVVRRVRP